MKQDSFERVLHFLIGASWGFIILGALLTFKIFAFFGLIVAVLAVFVFLFFSLFFVLLLDHFVTTKKILKEKEKQTALLTELLEKKGVTQEDN